MKKIYLSITIASMIAVLTAIALTPAISSNFKSTTLIMSDTIPGNLNAIFEKSCMPCHAEAGNHMAMAHLNFSDWNTYESSKQAGKAEAICKELSSGGMPPKSFKNANPDAIPTEAQIDSICAWSKTLVTN